MAASDIHRQPAMITEFWASTHLLFSRRFGTFWFASLLSNIGTWTQQVAEPWLLLTLGASSFIIGLDSFALNAPVWLLILLGGVLADRCDRRKVIAWFQAIQMLCPATLVVLLITHCVHPWMIIVVSVVVGITDALSMPAFLAVVPMIVAHDQLGRGLALNSIQFNLSRVLGPVIAGVLMSGFGAVACFAVNALSYVPFIGLVLWIIPRHVLVATGMKDMAPNRYSLSGIRQILHHVEQRGALITVLIMNVFCAPIIIFIPILVRNAFHGNAANFSMAVASFGMGALLGAACLLGIPARIDRLRLSCTFAMAFGVIMMVLALTTWFWVVLALLALAGATMTVCSTAANTLLQSMARPHLLGQTISLSMLATRGGLSLGALLTGLEINLIGIDHAFLINGIAAVVLQVTLVRVRELPPSDAVARACP